MHPRRTASQRNTAHLFDGIAFFDVSGLTYEAGIRASIGQAVPLLALYSIDRLDLAFYASFAAFTAIYGREEPYRSRWWSVALVALGLVGSISLGVISSHYEFPMWVVFAILSAVIIVTHPLSYVIEWIPRGSLFFVFAFVVTASRPVAESPTVAIMVAAASATFSWLVVMSGWFFRLVPAFRRRMRPLPLAPDRTLRSGTEPAIVYLTFFTVLGVLVAGGLALALDQTVHHYWAIVTVAAIFVNPAALVSFDRMMHRIIGTFAGVGLAAALFGGTTHPLYLILVIATCAFIVEVIISRHYGAALSFITPLAIGASNLGGTNDWETLFVDRSRETFLGAAVTFVIILGLRWQLHRRGLLRKSLSVD